MARPLRTVRSLRGIPVRLEASTWVIVALVAWMRTEPVGTADPAGSDIAVAAVRGQQANQSRATRGRGQALIRPCVDALRAIVPNGRPACRAKASPVGRQILGEPGLPLGDLAAREMLEHLAGDISL